MRKPNLRLTALVALATAVPGYCDTLVIDDDGGPGVDFLDLPPAVLAASDGDLLLVQPGSYSGFQTSKGITMLGSSDVVVDDWIKFAAVPGGREVRLSNLTIRTLYVEDCEAPVMVESVDMNPHLEDGYLEVEDSADVRLQGLTADPGRVVVRGSRVEVVRCAITGLQGYSPDDIISGGGDGYPALKVHHGSEVHVARSSLTGGRGGDTNSVTGEFAGDGGPGIDLFPGSEAFVAGLATDLIRGNLGGEGYYPGSDGLPGPGISNWGSLRLSGVTVHGGDGYTDPIEGPGSVDMPATPDPFLSFETEGDTATAGESVTITVHGPVGANVRVALGRTPVVESTLGIFGDLLTVPVRLVPAGQIGGDGTLVYVLNVPANLSVGFLVIAQAFITEMDGTTTRTHSVPFLIH